MTIQKLACGVWMHGMAGLEHMTLSEIHSLAMWLAMVWPFLVCCGLCMPCALCLTLVNNSLHLVTLFNGVVRNHQLLCILSIVLR